MAEKGGGPGQRHKRGTVDGREGPLVAGLGIQSQASPTEAP